MSVALHSKFSKTTSQCYEFWDRVFRRSGVLDYTEGFYDGDPTLSYQEAQHKQIRFLLDAVDCRAGSRILDIGCGNGSLLDEVRRRGATGVGVTISLPQVEYCRQRELDVHLLDYRNVGERWDNRFDAVVANGSIEHFVQLEDACKGRADAIYAEFFAVCHRCIDPHSTSRRLINTTIHFDSAQIPPRVAMASPWSFPWGSHNFHYAWLVRGFGGYYPTLGQLQRCACPYFNLIHQRDATQDYQWTSEEWLRHGKRSLFSLRQWSHLLPFAMRHPVHTTRMMFLLLVTQSWNWQFRTAQPPMKHLWQIWEYQSRGSDSTL